MYRDVRAALDIPRKDTILVSYTLKRLRKCTELLSALATSIITSPILNRFRLSTIYALVLLMLSYVYECVYECTSAYTSVRVRMRVYECVCECTSISVCMYIYVCTSISVYVYTYMYTIRDVSRNERLRMRRYI